VTTTLDASDADLAKGACDDRTGECTLRATEITVPAGTFVLSVQTDSEPITQSRSLLLVPGRCTHDLSRGKGVVFDLAGHRERRLSATWASTSSQVNVLTSPEAICAERRIISSPPLG
jgi:hypothetical protein